MGQYYYSVTKATLLKCIEALRHQASMPRLIPKEDTPEWVLADKLQRRIDMKEMGNRHGNTDPRADSQAPDENHGQVGDAGSETRE